ncbi:glycoside hydrolase family 2 [Devosia sp. A16]|uniref:glycoside hydrolase family 2 n=1 Tax=Devosia sp. A16 TaxID=1736675 RepID=UPI0006D7FF94|nr:glycoside hydrolase family 2 [Devosia sp. A16]
MHQLEIRQWQFTLADEPDAWAKGYDDSGWRAVSVPHDWSIEQPFGEHYSSGTGYLPGGIGWYRAHVSLASIGDIAGKHVRLKFHGVYKNARVWVNGYHVGGRPSGYAEFSFDLTEILSYANSDDLVISVRVEHTDISDSRWYNGSGINRRVVLELHQPVRIAEYGTRFETLSADPAEATVRVTRTLVNGTATAVKVAVRHELRALSSGRSITFETALDLPAGATADSVAIATVLQPELWSDTSPNLYRLTSILSWGSGQSAAYEETVGIRTFRFDAEHGFFINGEPRTLKGVCLHEDAGPFGTAVPSEVWLRRLLALKQLGCNGVRMAHNPHAPELYRLCDALGLFVIDEAFDEWENAKNKWWQGHNVYPPRHQGYARDFHEWGERDLLNMVDAHRNHASIIAWSIGNEIDYPNDPYASAMFEAMTGNNDANKSAKQRAYDPNRPDARRLATISRRLAAIVKGKDPTRPVTVGAAFPELSRYTGFLEPLDLVGYNYKEHLYPADHRKFPGQPIVGSENGHGYPEWRAVVDNAYISGQYLWTGIDYLGETDRWPYHGSRAGLLTLAGFPKHSAQLRRSWWSDEPVAYIATRKRGDEAKNLWSHPIARAWDDIAGGTVDVICFSNGEPRLSCGGAEVPLIHDAAHGYWVAGPLPAAAPLLLETRRGGDVVAHDALGPRGDAVRIEATVWRAPDEATRRYTAAGLADDGVIQVECTLRDAGGEIARNELIVAAEATGAQLLFLESGDLGDNTPYAVRERRSFEGRLIVFVRADGPAALRLRAAGLPELEIPL